MSRLLDLSHPLGTGMRVYPGDPAVTVDPALTVAADGVNVLRLHLGSQSGTHVDAPFHVRDDLARLDEVPLEAFAGPCVVVDVRGLAPRTEIPADALDPVRDRLAPGVVVLLATGWDAFWDSGSDHPDPYLAHPWPSPALARDLVDAGVRCVGVDALSVDRTPDPAEPASAFSLETHLVLAEAGAVIAENLRGLGPLLDARAAGHDVRVALFPLHLPGSDGAPVRAVATIDETRTTS